MASADISARLRYLNDSAHLLASTAPATSKYLMSKCNSFMFDNGIERSELHRRKTCGACGSIMILGWYGKLEVESEGPRREKNPSKKTKTQRARAMVYKCGVCGRTTRIDISSSAPDHKLAPLSKTKHSSNITQASNTSLLLGNSLPSQPKPNITSSTASASKKRTKARKQDGLEALLARQKASDSRGSGFGLDLLDLMKKT